MRYFSGESLHIGRVSRSEPWPPRNPKPASMLPKSIFNLSKPTSTITEKIIWSVYRSSNWPECHNLSTALEWLVNELEVSLTSLSITSKQTSNTCFSQQVNHACFQTQFFKNNLSNTCFNTHPNHMFKHVWYKHQATTYKQHIFFLRTVEQMLNNIAIGL